MKEGVKKGLVLLEVYEEREREDLEMKWGGEMGGVIMEGVWEGMVVYKEGKEMSKVKVEERGLGIVEGGGMGRCKSEYMCCGGWGGRL